MSYDLAKKLLYKKNQSCYQQTFDLPVATHGYLASHLYIGESLSSSDTVYF